MYESSLQKYSAKFCDSKPSAFELISEAAIVVATGKTCGDRSLCTDMISSHIRSPDLRKTGVLVPPIPVDYSTFEGYKGITIVYGLNQ